MNKTGFRVAHCNICGAVIAVKFDDTKIDINDPMVFQHREYHKATFAAIDIALGKNIKMSDTEAYKKLQDYIKIHTPNLKI